MRDIKHFIEILFSNLDDLNKFCQIYHIDSTQKQLNRRINDDTSDNVLKDEILRVLQRLMRNINSYAKTFKLCEKRLKKNLNSMIKIHLKQTNFNKLTKEVHNKFIFDEMTIVIIISKNMKREQIIKRDI